MLVLPAPVDYDVWSIAPLGRDVSRLELLAGEKVAVLSGQRSPLARRNLTARAIPETFTIAAEG